MKSKSLIRGFSIAAIVAVAFLGGVMLASGLHMTAKAAAEPPPAPPPAVVNQPSHQFDFATLAERVVPSVVSVYSTDIVQPEELRREMGRRGRLYAEKRWGKTGVLEGIVRRLEEIATGRGRSA